MLNLTPWASFLIVVLVVVLVAVIVRLVPADVRLRGRIVALGRTFAHGPWLPLLIGVATGVATFWVWGSLSRSAVVHDESAYLLQAQLFADGRFTAPTPPLYRFFEQLYVNLVPAVFSKYPPGTSLLIAPGMKYGLPGLPIVVANALTGMLVFVLARRFAGVVVAMLTWARWVTSFPVLYFHAMYLSEVPTSLAWLATWWGIARWRRSGRTYDLAIAAFAIAYCGITRPLTAVALAIAVGIVILRVRRTTRPLLRRAELATLATGAVLALGFVGIWSWRSTGNPALTPLTLYTRTYVPFDKLGFGARAEDAPKASLPWDQQVTDRAFYEEHQRHTVTHLPVAAVSRARMIGRDMWYDWRGGLALVALVGLAGAPTALWVGLGALALQLLLYLLYAHPPTWSLYYIEGLPVLAFATALGVPVLLSLGTRGRVPGVARLVAGAALFLLMVYPAWVTMHQVQAQISADHAYYDAFRGSLPSLPDSAAKAIVFVRYSRAHNDGLSLVRNVPHMAGALYWIAYDRGAENTTLMSVAPDRIPYLFDEAGWRMHRLNRDGTVVKDSVRVRKDSVMAQKDTAVAP
jgi:hypothetical protein